MRTPKIKGQQCTNYSSNWSNYNQKKITLSILSIRFRWSSHLMHQCNDHKGCYACQYCNSTNLTLSSFSAFQEGLEVSSVILIGQRKSQPNQSFKDGSSWWSEQWQQTLMRSKQLYRFFKVNLKKYIWLNFKNSDLQVWWL